MKAWSRVGGVIASAIPGERDQSDQVARAAGEAFAFVFLVVALDEAAGDVLDGRQPIDVLAVDLEIHRLHAARAVDDHFDGDAFGVDDRLLAAFARAGQGDDHSVTAASVSAAGSQASRCRQVGRRSRANCVELNGTATSRDRDQSRHATTGSNSSNRKNQGL